MSRTDTIVARLEAALRPSHLEVVNESHMHSVPKGAETHFKVVVVAEAFAGLPLLQRHRKINELLAGELAAGLHALSIHAFTPDQWTSQHDTTSPACKGGAGK